MENYEKSGKTFIAYQGTELTKSDITMCLNAICPTSYTVKCVTRDNNDIIFAKTIYNNYTEDRDPFMYTQNKTLAVSGYNQDEISMALRNFNFSIDDSDRYHLLINVTYENRQNDMFKSLAQFMSFCSVIWDENNNKLIGGVTNANNKYTHLYYGYTKNKNELIYSNDRNILYNFCDEVKEMQNNTYMIDNIIYNLDGLIVGNNNSNNNNNNLIKKSRENADHLLDGLNAILLAITSEAVKEKIEENLEEYLASDDPKKKITDYIINELDSATQKEVLSLIKKALVNFNLEQNIEQKLKNNFDNILEKYTKSINVPVSYNIYLNNTKIGQTKGGFHHECFEDILVQTQLDEPIMLIGPAGSGKNVAISQVADALGLKMYYTNNASNEFKLTGFIDAGGNYHETEFYKAFKNGGLFFLDEIDNSDSSALIVINSALANGYMAFPHETIDRHENFRIVAAANTWGKGADLQYVGRNALDAASLDRFDNIFFDYDKKLEECLYSNEEVLKFMWTFRDAVLKAKIPHVVSTRGIGKVYKKEINGIAVSKTLTSNVVKGLSQDDVNTIIGNMNNISSNNKYYDGLKKLTLRR